MKPGQREPTEAEKRLRVPYAQYWREAPYPQPGDISYQPVGVFEPRNISDFLWERDEEAYPPIWGLYRSAKRDVGAL